MKAPQGELTGLASAGSPYLLDKKKRPFVGRCKINESPESAFLSLADLRARLQDLFLQFGFKSNNTFQYRLI
jgi:hypothetical protein